MTTKKELTNRQIAANKKAYFDYEIGDKLEAGIMLSGAEVKACRAGKVNMKGSYVAILSDGPYVMDLHITKYEFLDDKGYEPKQKRKILLNKKEIGAVSKAEKESGVAIIPTQMYFKNGLIKIEIGFAKGKKLHDKRNSIKNKDLNRQISRTLKNLR
jgi:SsrA-binding protein